MRASCVRLHACCGWPCYLGSQYDWTASPPCPPWPQAGKAMGLNAEEDRAFLQMFARAKLAAPLAICLVNVSNISLHPHFSMIEAFIRRRGYEIVWQQVHDVVQFSPTYRNRWLACAVRADLAHEVSKREALMLNKIAPWNHACYSFNLPLSLVGALTLDDALMQIYGLVSWLPEPKRTKLETALRSHPRCDLCVCSTCNPCRGARVLMVTVVGLGTSDCLTAAQFK